MIILKIFKIQSNLDLKSPSRNKIFLKVSFFSLGKALQTKIKTSKTMNKKGPSLQVEKIMKKRLKLEYDFYNFVKDRFHRLKAEMQSSSP